MEQSKIDSYFEEKRELGYMYRKIDGIWCYPTFDHVLLETRFTPVDLEKLSDKF